jgi:hypothetical protein
MPQVKQRSRSQRLALEILGWVLVVAGLAALVLPGPGLLLLAAGLYVHSLSYEWAERLLEPVKRQAFKTAADSVETWPRIVFSSILAVVICGVGVVWGIGTPVPSWWPLDEDWWLLGGWGAGVVLIGSGIVALGLIVWSYKTFRIEGETIEDVLEERGLDEDD